MPVRALVLVSALSCAVLARTPLTAAIVVTAADRSLQPGELVVLTIVTPAPVTAVRARAFDHDLAPYRLDDRTWRVLVGIDLETAPKSYPVAISAGEANEALTATYTLAVKAKAFETRTLTVDDAFVNPPASTEKEIADDAARLTQMWAHSAPARLWSEPFVRPVPQEANSAFGKRSVFNGQPRGQHTGADFVSPAGTPVHAPNAGRVVLARELYFTGNTVVIDHGLGLFSLFAHFSETDVHEGDMVVPGQIVGKVGATGRVTGPHLHWAVRIAGARVDPLSVLALLGSTKPS